jgi:hypothetical protein
MTYEQAFADWEYLWSIAPAYDMTGGYEDQYDLDKLIRSPTKRTAKKCLCSQIQYWFQAGPDDDGKYGGASKYIAADKRVREIAERHGEI